MAVLARQYSGICYNNNGSAYYCRTGWNTWGRWVALAVIVIVAFLLFFLCSCYSARRRRKVGQQPFYGTGWAGQAPFGHGQANYNPGYNNQNPPPAYGQQNEHDNSNSGGYYGRNQGYFGGQQTDTEMQPPQNVYHGADNSYQPPSGPPPGKAGNGIVR